MRWWGADSNNAKARAITADARDTENHAVIRLSNRMVLYQREISK
jgi:hypothetical protein